MPKGKVPRTKFQEAIDSALLTDDMPQWMRTGKELAEQRAAEKIDEINAIIDAAIANIETLRRVK